MRRALIIALVPVLLFVLSACKGGDSGGKSNAGVALKWTHLNNMPGPKGTPGLKQVSGIKQGQTVYLLKPKKKAPGYYYVSLADRVTKGWVAANDIFIGEKKPVTFTEVEGVYLYKQPDEASIKFKFPYKAGRIGYIIKELDNGWYLVSFWGRKAAWWAKEGSFVRGRVKPEKKDEDYTSKQFSINTAAGSGSVRASSWLGEAAGYKYTPDLAFDGRLDTSWQEGKTGENPGVGEWIEITLPSDRLYTISLINGFAHTDEKYGDLYQLNSRVKTVKVQYGANLEFATEVTLKDGEKGLQELGNFKTPKLRLTIMSVYPGSKWQDTSISEIKVRPTATETP